MTLPHAIVVAAIIIAGAHLATSITKPYELHALAKEPVAMKLNTITGEVAFCTPGGCDTIKP